MIGAPTTIFGAVLFALFAAVTGAVACGGDDGTNAGASDGSADGASESASDGSTPDATLDARADASPNAHADAAPQDGRADHAVDSGPAFPVRAWLMLAPHDSAILDLTISGLYDPTSPTFRQYVSHADFLAQFAPTQADVDAVTAWLATQSLTVKATATNRLLLEIAGSSATLENAFQMTLANAGAGADSYVFATPPVIPPAVSAIIAAVIAPDIPAPTGGPPADLGTATMTGPASPTTSFLAKDIAGAYGAATLYAAGSQGAGATIGVVGTGGGRPSDLHTFWGAQAITRNDPVVVTVTTPPTSFSTEATIDLEWAGAIAPAADLIFYGAPDNHDGSLLFAMNEAVGIGVATVITDSFSHHEADVPVEVRAAYDAVGRFAAATGITLVAASGDSSMVDTPGSSAWWTAVGGTTLTLAANGSIATEVAWPNSGCGLSALEAAPTWQTTTVPTAGGKRAVVDVSVQANSYFALHEQKWQALGGTSFASPVAAGLFAVVTSARISAGKPAIGYLNPILYGTPAVQAALRDVTTGTSGANAAAVGWDFPTGFGSLNAATLADALP